MEKYQKVTGTTDRPAFSEASHCTRNRAVNINWPKSPTVTQIDPITEISFVTYEKRFVPGLDYLGGGIFVGLLIFSATFLPARSPKKFPVS